MLSTNMNRESTAGPTLGLASATRTKVSYAAYAKNQTA